MLLFSTFYSPKNLENVKNVSTKILSNTTVFNIDNDKKAFFIIKSAN